jgi:hypothetical protein
MEMVPAGIASALGILVILLQFDFRKVLGFSLYIDIITTGGLTWIFAGTFSGMMAAIFGGLTISLILAISKKMIGYKSLTISGWDTHPATW